VTDEFTIAPSDLPARPAPPPLRIHHLLLWTIVAAALLTRLSLQRASRSDWGNSETDWALIAITQVIIAAGITLSALSLYWYAKGFDVFSQPGQWLPFLSLYVMLEYWLVTAVQMIFPTGRMQSKELLLWNFSDALSFCGQFLQSILMWGVAATFYFLAARKVADTRPWRIFLILSAVGLAFQGGTNMMWTACYLTGFGVSAYVNLWQQTILSTVARWLSYPGGWVLGAILLACPIVDDLVRRRPRYWTHWAGATISLAARLAIIARILLS
jgi:hypothetical protein